jgi:hypothetical protein
MVATMFRFFIKNMVCSLYNKMPFAQTGAHCHFFFSAMCISRDIAAANEKAE